MEYGNERNWYNGDGLRVRAKTFPNGASPVTDDYVWDVGGLPGDSSTGLPQVLQDSRTQGRTTTTTTYLYGLGLIATTDTAGTASYYLADGLGSTTQLVDGSGSVTDTYTYDVFGALRTASGSTTNPFDFAGQQTDHTANRGLQYLRARHYDPSLGRFLGRDPVPFAQRYVYAENDPINHDDPTGQARGDDPVPFPVPVPGTEDGLNECNSQWQECQRLALSIWGAKGGRGPTQPYFDICTSLFRRCLHSVDAGDGPIFDWDEAVHLMRDASSNRSLLERVSDAASSVPRSLRLPSTGSGGLLNRNRKEGSFGCGVPSLW